MAKNEKKSSDKKKTKKNFGQNGVVHIKSSFNNTIVTISDVSGPRSLPTRRVHKFNVSPFGIAHQGADHIRYILLLKKDLIQPVN